jgi:nicotinamide-nucleotide amidase
VRAFVIAVGSELLETDRLDTNSLRLTESFLRYGVRLVGKSVAGDTVDAISHQLAAALQVAEVVVVTGGLGPTSDDLTREAVAALLGRGLRESDEVVADIRRRFDRFGMEMPDVNRRQAMVIDGGTLLANRRGTAPGQRLERDGRTVFLLPGVPAELDAMLGEHLEAWMAANGGRLDAAPHSHSLKVACRSESAVEEELRPVYEAFGSDEITVLASAGDVEVRFTTPGPAARATPRLGAMLEAARRALGPAVYAEGREATLEQAVGDLLARGGHTVATAESCTGGLIAERLTDVAGSSAYFLGGVVAYSDRIKEEVLGVPRQVLGEAGAVSEATAVEMARRVRLLLGADLGLAATGIAGPSGGSQAKPVGTVHVAVSGPATAGGDQVAHRLLSLPGDRQRVRRLASQWGLELLRRALLAT